MNVHSVARLVSSVPLDATRASARRDGSLVRDESRPLRDSAHSANSAIRLLTANDPAIQADRLQLFEVTPTPIWI
jgi:hypothetical protein